MCWGFSHLLESVPLKLLEAKDVQDADFERGVTGTKGEPQITDVKTEMTESHTSHVGATS